MSECSLSLIERIVPRRRYAPWARYHVPRFARSWSKLDAMENPYPPARALRGSWHARLAEVALNRYPVPGRRQRSRAQLEDV
ncbi:hypothetical protein ACU4GD_43685 [Cupriavidus basilensis]